MLKFQNAKRTARFNRAAFKWGCFGILAVTAIALCASVVDVHQLPSLTQLVDFGSAGTLCALPIGGVLGLNRMMFLKENDGGGGGGGENKDYVPKDDFEKAVLGAQKTFAEQLKNHGGDITKVKEAYAEIAQKLIDLQKNQMSIKSRSLGFRIPGQVSIDAARHLGVLVLAIEMNRGRFSGRDYEMVEGQVKELFGAEWKAALTSADIPLPVEYSSEVVELVSLYGTARRYGTVYPLGSGSVKLPKLTTSPTFGLIAMSAPIPEKSPQFGWVTFNAEKFGGLIRLPTEIDEDSTVAMGQFLARYAAREIAKVEDINFWTSTGAGSGANGSVEGLTISTITNSKVVQMAATKTHYSDATIANFRALRTIPDEAVYGMAAYHMHPSFEQLLSTFNTGGDRPYNPQAQIAGTGANPITTGPTLDGFPIRWVNTMPAYSTAANVSKVFALFGDPSYQYLGIRGGIRIETSKDAGFTTDEILIRALERFTIGLMATGAVAGLETAAA